MTTSYEEWIEKKESRRIQGENKAWNKLCKLSERANQMIGELVRNGEIIYYIWPINGKYREDQKHNLVDFLIRNRYV